MSNVLLDRVLKNGEPGTRVWLGPTATMEQVAQAVCGLLNQQGGFVIWGAASRTRVTGLQHSATKAVELTGLLGRAVKPGPLVIVVPHAIKDREVLVVEVGAGSHKPYRFQQAIWIRLGAHTLRAEEGLVRSMVQDAAIRPLAWEEQLLMGMELADIDATEFDRACSDIRRVGRVDIADPIDPRTLLEKLYLFRNGQLTRAASVLFASDPQKWSAAVEVRLNVFSQSGRTAPDSMARTWTGPAIRVLEQAVSVLSERTMRHVSFARDALRREEAPAYAVSSLREALVNAIAHRDYTRSGAIVIEEAPDRLVFRNPGHLPQGWSVGDLKRKHLSNPFNPHIARVFLVRGFMEMLGMGTLRLVEDSLKARAKPPVWEVAGGEVRLTLFAAPAPQPMDLSDGHVHILKALDVGKPLSIGQLARNASVGDRQVRRYLIDLIASGAVKRTGSGRTTRYQRVPDRF